ncbi:Alpha/Beta hydrolase protein [Paraphoma chrysanthemicola]|uniref:Alpha/Beta hydrolase protein n=1 Tax=Paraphoma chrysanthemicola TaxID=798071 RepID=A0A8K0RH34_9PLEO|nr:Alpha/Beta hydrolase protein [Paraphoma chrysanthemicola]
MSSFTLETEHGLISITDTALKNDAPALLLIHGNSSSSRIFYHIFASPNITERFRIVAFDLPGHGSSSKAPDPDKSYHQRGYAHLAVHILQHLNIDSVIILGWSLGGHIGIEMIELLKSPSTYTNSKKIDLHGLMITGTPPALGREQIRQGFVMATQNGELGLAGQRDWTDIETMAFSKNSAAAGIDKFWEPWMYEDAKNTDGRARMIMARNFVGDGDEGPIGVDQRRVVETEDVLIAVVNGEQEQFVNLVYLDGIKWKKLWKGKCIRLEGLHHAPFWEASHDFEKVLLEFCTDCGDKREV